MALSQHGVDGHLGEEAAKTKAAFANSVLADINRKFDRPVSQLIGERWYQVPSRFDITEARSSEQETPAFTISHHNCGLYEFDFTVDDGVGRVVANRYDSLGINW